MIDKIEMSLDDIIQSNRGKGGAKRGGAKRGGSTRGGQNRTQGTKPAGAVIKGRQRGGITRSKYTRGDVNSAWKHDMFEGARKQLGGLSLGGGRPQLQSGKLMVSNLDYGVSDSDINELFAEFGPLKTAAVHYDRSGRSLGTADVVFERRADAAKAMKQYNGVPLDGRPMSIQLATSDIPVITPRTPKAPVQQRNQTRGGGRGKFGGPGQRRQGGAGRGGQSGAASGVRRGATKAPTLEELDAELDAYTKDSIV